MNNTIFSELRMTKRSSSRVLDGITFLIGITGFFHFKLVGEFYPAEIVLILMIPLLWKSRSGLLRDPLVKRILFFGALWFLGQVATDLIRATPTSDLLRGWASIAIFLLEFVGLYMLISGRVARLELFLIGFSLGGLIQPTLLPNDLSIGSPWKFGYGPPVTLVLLLAITYFSGGRLKRIQRWVILLLALGVFSFFSHFRSLAAFILLTAFLVYFRDTKLGVILNKHFRLREIVIVVFIVSSASFGILQAYGYAARQGWLGEQTLHKYQFESGGKYGLILGGRIESLASIPAIINSPIIGHGSWAKGPKYRNYLYELLALGYGRSEAQITWEIDSSDLIPAHSYILQAWVWSGILGAIFWLVILLIVMRSTILTYRYPNELILLVIFFSISSIWAIFFSPFGSAVRMQMAFQLTLFLLSYQLSRAIQQRAAVK